MNLNGWLIAGVSLACAGSVCTMIGSEKSRKQQIEEAVHKEIEDRRTKSDDDDFKVY